MKFKFPTHDIAESFAWGLGVEDELDLVAHAEGDEVEILGVDDHEDMVEECTRIAELLGGKRITEPLETTSGRR